MSALTEVYDRIAQLEAQIEEMKGRKGVSALRSELAKFQERTAAWDARRAQMKRSMAGATRLPRSDHHVYRTRDFIKAAAQATVGRGNYQEIVLSIPSGDYWRWTEDVTRITLPRYISHPELQKLRPWLTAWQVIDDATDADLIPESFADFDRKGRGVAVNKDLYAYNEDGTLVLLQVRRTEITKYRNTTVRYFVTDGETAVEITNGKKSLIKKAAQTDPNPIAPLRIVKPTLPDGFQNRIDGDPFKLTGSSPKVNRFTAHKICRVDYDGTLLSLYDGTTYTLGKTKVQASRPQHKGGYYVYSGEGLIENYRANRIGKLYTGRYAMIECECWGNVEYYDWAGNHVDKAWGIDPSQIKKMSVSFLRPIRIVEEFTVECAAE